MKRRGRISYRINGGTLIIDLKHLHRIISSAPRGGGIVRARSILNHQVPANPMALKRPTTVQWGDPSRYLGRLGVRIKVRRPMVGLMTAVPMTQLVADREASGRVWVECFCTVGVTNAVQAGEPVRLTPGMSGLYGMGTINIVLITNATLTTAALVGAVQVATESKTGTLIKNKVRSTARTSSLATGTGTDAVVVASSLKGIHKMSYSGTHTEIGAMIGRLVARCVQEGLTRSHRWSQTRSHNARRA
ncbi:MAG TPA: adenosylcobinamide amidohydrolase [Nitrospira sp.]|nr:adenosylcobinamide amidohydrolase [Nitrospira sp.]